VSKCILIISTTAILWNRIGEVIIKLLTSSAVGLGFETRSGQTKDYKISIVAFPLSTHH
jgi:hypothetical protein